MNRAKCIPLLVLTLSFLTGFFWGKSKVDTVQGVWKSEMPHEGQIWFLQIGKDYVILGDDRDDGLIFEEKEGVVLVRKAGGYEPFARIVLRDDDHIVYEFAGNKPVFIRSNAEEMNRINNPPVKNIAGSYRNEDGTMLFELSESGVVKNGVPLGCSIVGRAQMYFAARDNVVQFALTPVEDGKLQYREQPGTHPVILFKVAPEEAAMVLANIEISASLSSRVEMANFSVIVPGPGGDMRPLNFNLVLELWYLPEEKRPGAARPTRMEMEVFRTVVVQLESKIRDHMTTFLAGQSFTNLMGDRGPELVKAEAMRFVNNELERYDFAAMRIPEGFSRRRVTNVLLPAWTLM